MPRPRVLVLSPRPPDRRRDGLAIRNSFLLEALSQLCEIELLVLEMPEAGAVGDEIRKMVSGLIEVPTRRRSGRRLRAALESVLSGLPYSVGLYRSSRFADAAQSRAAAFLPDVIVAQSYHMASYLLSPAGPPTAVDFHNVDSEIWGRLADLAPRTPLGAFCRLQARQVRGFERRILGRIDLATCVSGRDADTIAGLASGRPGLRVSVIENGAALDRRPFRADPASGGEILFVGDLGWPPNADGMCWFAERVWPAIAASRPEAHVRAIGRNAPRRLRRLAGPRFELPGEVPDTDRDFREAAVFAVPLRIGGGTRLKILEAAAAGVPVVSTSVGAEGLELREGEDIVLRDAPADFAAAVADLLADPARRRSLAARARRTVEARHDFRVIGSRYAAEICRLAAADGSRP